jgi:hypothetical protein
MLHNLLPSIAHMSRRLRNELLVELVLVAVLLALVASSTTVMAGTKRNDIQQNVSTLTRAAE